MTSCVSYLEMATIRYDNGQVRTTGKFFNDYDGPIIRIGLWQEYYPNGQLKSQRRYAKDYRFYRCPQNVPSYYNYKTGPWVYYYQNGNIRAKGTYKVINIAGEFRSHEFGVLDSTWIFFDKNGTKTKLIEEDLLPFRLVPYDEKIENPEIFLIYDQSRREIDMKWINKKTAHNNK